MGKVCWEFQVNKGKRCVIFIVQGEDGKSKDVTVVYVKK